MPQGALSQLMREMAAGTRRAPTEPASTLHPTRAMRGARAERERDPGRARRLTGRERCSTSPSMSTSRSFAAPRRTEEGRENVTMRRRRVFARCSMAQGDEARGWAA